MEINEKGKAKQGQRLNEITDTPEEEWTGGYWKQWSDQSWHAEADTSSWREDDWYEADSSFQASAAAEEFQRASSGELRQSIFGFAQHTESFQLVQMNSSREPSHLVLILKHAKLSFLLITQQHVGIWSTKIHYLDVRTALPVKVYDQG